MKKKILYNKPVNTPEMGKQGEDELKDLIDLNDISSLVREPFNTENPIVLSQTKIEKTSIPDSYKSFEVYIEKEDLNESGRLSFDFPEKVGEMLGCDFKELKIADSVYEALLNAYQHGHGEDASKPIKIHFKSDKKRIEILVEDQGGVLNPQFIPFALRHREPRNLVLPKDFYTFAQIEKPEGNHGYGTFFIHKGFDQVTYHRSENDGLIVRMVKQIKSDA